MLSSLTKAIGGAIASITGPSDGQPLEEAADPNAYLGTGKKVEIWVETGEPLKDKPVTRFAAKLVNRHAHGQWVVCDWETHLVSNNPSFNGFQKIYRKKYKPTKFKQESFVILNSDDGTDSSPEVWAHVTKVLNEFASADVHIEREAKSTSMRKKK